MSEIVLFDYGQLDVETRITVKQRTEEIKTLVRRSAQDIIDVGTKLIDVKGMLEHGEFGNWLDKEFGWTDKTAQRFMQVSHYFKNDKLSDLKIGASALYLLAAPSTPEPARLEAIERAEAGETITHTVAKQIVAQHRPAPTPPPTSTPQRTLEASVPAFTPPTSQPHLDESIIRVFASPPVDRPQPVIEPEPRRPATPPSRQLSDEEAHAVVWRVLERQCDVGKAIAPKSLQMQRDWLVKADWSLFHDALATGVRFANGQLLQTLNLVKGELEGKIAHFTVNFVEKPQPAPPIVEPEETEKDKDEYYTPDYILEPARSVLGRIDLDPASCAAANTVVKATTYLNKQNDGLRTQIPWLGNIWLNPPYSNPLPWIEKLFAEYEAGRLTAALVLVNTANSPQWARLLWQSEAIVCLLSRRIKFWRADQHEGKGFDRDQMIFYIGKEHAKFRNVFGELGAIR